MNLVLKPGVKKRIDERVKSGQYAFAEDVASAAIMTLDQQERFMDFAQGELDRLPKEGERSIAKHGTLDGEQAYRNRKARRHRP